MNKAARAKAKRRAKAKDRCLAAWRVYDAICDLGVADASPEHRAEIARSRKLAWDRYHRFSKAWGEAELE